MECLFIMVPYVATSFHNHFNAYEVGLLPNEHIIGHQKDFADYHILSFSRSFSASLSDLKFVCLKYHVFPFTAVNGLIRFGVMTSRFCCSCAER